MGLALGARAQSTAPYASTFSRIGGYSCIVYVTLTTNNFLYIYGTNVDTTNVDIDLMSNSWYTLEFTAEGTDLTCTLYDEDGTTVVGSQTMSDGTYTSGYNGTVPYTRFGETSAWYVLEYTVSVIPGAPRSAPTVEITEYTFCSEPSDLTQDDTESEYTDMDYTYGTSCSSSDDDSDCLLMIGSSAAEASGFLYDEDSANYGDTTVSTLPAL